jgi:hypothetical protein
MSRAHCILIAGLVAASSLTSIGPAQMLPPGALNQSAFSDSGADIQPDHALGADGVIHAVWASQVPLVTGAGNDPDIYYSRLEAGVWSQPVLVNSYGTSDNLTPAHDEREPHLVVAADGTVTCVWQSTWPLGQAATDTDIFAAVFNGVTWGPAEKVNDADGDNAQWVDDTGPTIVLTANNEPLVAWHNLNHADGDDDILYSIRESGIWSPPAELNQGSPDDDGDDWGPVGLVRTSEGTVVATWSTDNPHIGLGSDRDIVYATYSSDSGWGPMAGVSALAVSDSGEDTDPVVVAIESQGVTELHFVWSSTNDIPDPLGGTIGSDRDILHAVITGLQTIPPMNPTFIVNSNAVGDSGQDNAPSICVEPAGVVHVGWQTADAFVGDQDLLHSANATAGDGWEAFSVLSLNGLFDGAGEDDVAVDLECGGGGLLSAVWQSSDDLGQPTGPIGADDDILHAFGLGRVVSRPDAVDPAAAVDTSEDLEARAMEDATGVVHVVWSSSGGPGGSDTDILYSEGGPTGWSAPIPVNAGATTDSASDINPVVAVDSAGTVYVAWASTNDLGGPIGSDYDILLSRRVGGVWSNPEAVNASATTDNGDPRPEDRGPEISVAPDGTVHVVWVSHVAQGGLQSTLSWVAGTPGSWGPQTDITSPLSSGFVTTLSLLVDPLGRAHVVWTDQGDLAGSGTDADLWYATRPGTSWTSPEAVLSDTVGDASEDTHGRLGRRPNGELIVVWSSDREPGTTGADADLWLARRSPGESWGQPTLLLSNMASDVFDDTEPRLAVAGDRLAVLWKFVDLAAPIHDVDLAVASADLGDAAPFAAFGLLANTTGGADHVEEEDIDLTLGVGGVAHIVWDSQDDLGGTIGSDLDVLSAWIGIFEAPLFADGFESGDPNGWSSFVP